MVASEKTGGIVVALRPGHATVRVEADLACPRCVAGRGCGAGILARRGERIVEVGTPPGISLGVGQRVELVLEPARILHAAWLAYGLPLVAVLATAVVAGYLLPGTGSDGPAILMSIVALVGAGWWARRRLRSAGCLRPFVPALEVPPDRSTDRITGTG